MKDNVFANQLEAHVGQSPVCGGKAIKTDRKASNHLNQLLSRMKNRIRPQLTARRKTDSPHNPSAPQHLGNIIKFLMILGVTHGIQHFAIAFSKERYDYPNIVTTTNLTCIRLY